MTKPREITGAIFDLDGTLFDSMGVWHGFGARYLKEFHSIEARPEMDDVIHTLSIWEAADYFRQEYGVTTPQAQIVDEVNHMIEEEYFFRIHAKPGAIALLEKLQEKGVRMCVATATDRYQVEAALKREGMDGFFGKLFTSSEVGSGKQNPEIYLRAREFLGTSPETTWIFEDMLYAVKTAVKAGFPVVAVQDRYSLHHAAELRNLAAFYAENHEEIAAFFGLKE